MSGHTIVAIVPLYNGAEFIEGALDSILQQSRPPDEIVVVDDGSMDGGAALAARKLEGRADSRVLRKGNGGQSSARNFGVANSSSSLIALLDQDDLWYPNHLEELVRPFEGEYAYRLGWVYSNLDEVDRQALLVRRHVLGYFAAQHPKVDLYDCLAKDMHVLPSASLISRDAFAAVGGFDERLIGYEDDDLFLRLFRANYRNIYLPEALSQWRIYPGSTSGSDRMARSRGIYAKKLLSAFADDVQYPSFARNAIAPRFARSFFADIFRASLAKNRDMHRSSAASCWNIVPYLGSRRRLVVASALIVLGFYPLARFLVATRILTWIVDRVRGPARVRVERDT